MEDWIFAQCIGKARERCKIGAIRKAFDTKEIGGAIVDLDILPDVDREQTPSTRQRIAFKACFH